MSSGASRTAKKIDPVTWMMYGPRVAGWLFILVLLAVHFGRRLLGDLALPAVLSTLLWPQLAFLLAGRFRDPRRLERLFIAIDMFFFGAWLAVSSFDPWFAALLLNAMAMNSLSMGGLRLFGRALLAFSLGALCAGAWLGFALSGPTPAATMLATLIIMVTYAGWVSLLAYNQALRLAKSKAMLREASISDALTGLRNRRYFHQVVDQDIARALRGYQPYIDEPSQLPPHNADLVFLMVDIDHFKALNDSHGHEAGDQVLVQLAQRLKAHLRDSDSVIRWGGEEFLVVARSVNRPQIRVIAEKIRRTIEQFPFDLGNGTKLFKTCSIGYAPYPFFPRYPQRFGWSEVVALADEALYIAKNSQRNAWIGLVPDFAATPPEQQQTTPAQLLHHPHLHLESSLAPETPLVFPGPEPVPTLPLRV